MYKRQVLGHVVRDVGLVGAASLLLPAPGPLSVAARARPPLKALLGVPAGGLAGAGVAAAVRRRGAAAVAAAPSLRGLVVGALREWLARARALLATSRAAVPVALRGGWLAQVRIAGCAATGRLLVKCNGVPDYKPRKLEDGAVVESSWRGVTRGGRYDRNPNAIVEQEYRLDLSLIHI